MAVHRLESDDDDPEWPPDDFTGEWIVEWPNGQVCVRSAYVQGKPEGGRIKGDVALFRQTQKKSYVPFNQHPANELRPL